MDWKVFSSLQLVAFLFEALKVVEAEWELLSLNMIRLRTMLEEFRQVLGGPVTQPRSARFVDGAFCETISLMQGMVTYLFRGSYTLTGNLGKGPGKTELLLLTPVYGMF